MIIQKIREAERDMVYREFKHRQGDLVNGVVTRVEREGNLMVDLGKTEALLPRREQSFREVFKRGDRIRAHIIEVKRSSSGPQVILSRTHPVFLMRLFEMEVPEITKESLKSRLPRGMPAAEQRSPSCLTIRTLTPSAPA